MPIIIKEIPDKSYNIKIADDCNFHSFIYNFSIKMTDIICNNPNSEYYNMYNFFDPNNPKMYNIINVMCIIEYYLKRVINYIELSELFVSSLNISKFLPIDKIHPNYIIIYYLARLLSYNKSSNLQINIMTNSGVSIDSVLNAIMTFGFFPHNILIRYSITNKPESMINDVYFNYKTADIVYIQKPSSYFLLNNKTNISILLINHIYNLIDQCNLTSLVEIKVGKEYDDYHNKY